MSKIISILLLLLIASFIPIAPFTTKVLASSCTSGDVDIQYSNPKNGTQNENTFFPENGGDLTFQLSINNATTLKNLQNMKATLRLHFPGGLVGSDNADSNIVLIPTNVPAPYVFDLTLSKDANQAHRGDHSAEFQKRPNTSNDFEMFCDSVKYKVGTGDHCVPGPVQTVVPPDATYPNIPFIGWANTTYRIRQGKTMGILGNDVTTDNGGQGVFQNITPLHEYSGINDKLTIFAVNSAYTNECEIPLIIKANAPQPDPIPVGPVIPISQTITRPCPSANPDCTSAAGPLVPGCNDPKDPNDPTKTKPNPHPGIATAIGCIHTNPAEFVKDFMTFVIGISGGLAFLLMLLGVFQMMTSAGNPETLNAGRERFTSAIIGLLLVIFAILLLQIIGVGILNLPGFGK